MADGDVTLRYRLLGRDDASPAFNKAGKSAEALHGTMSKVGMLLGGVVAGGVVALGAAMVQGAKDAESYQTLQLKSAAVLKSTGNVAGTSVKQIDTLAASLETMSGVDEELIINSQNVLATFTGVRNEAGKGNDIFTQGTKAALDLSVAMGQDLQSSTVQLGKALNDPVKGITALQRVGVSFTQGQKDQIAAMVKSGDTMGAQKVILGELHKEFGGAAQAAGAGFGGAIARLQDVFSDAFRDLAAKYLPDLRRLADWLAAEAPNAIAAATTAFGNIKTGVKAAADIIIPTFNFIKDHSTTFGSLAVAIGTVVAAIKIWQAVTKAFIIVQAALDVVLSANPIGLVVIAIAALVAGLIYAYKHSETFRNIVNAVWAAVKGFVVAAINQIKGQIGTLVSALSRVIDWFRTFPGKVVGFLAGLQARMLQIGKDIINGLWQGLKDAAGAVLGWIGGLGGSIVGAARAAVGAHSPARKMIPIGHSIIDGIEVGLRERAPRIYTMLEEFGQRIGNIKVTARMKDSLEKFAVHTEADMRAATAKLDKIKDAIKAQQAKVADLIKARADYAAQLSQGVSGGGSIAGIQLAQDTTDENGNTVKADQAGGFLASLKAKADAIKKFGSDMNKLRAEGLSQDVLQQIAQAGLDTGGALAQALATATPATIKSINNLSKTVNTESDAFGKQWAGQMYDSGIKAAEGIVKGLQSKQSAILTAIRNLANEMVAEIKRTLKIKSPSGVMADEVGAMIPAGLVAGIQAGAGGVASAMRSLVSVPTLGPGLTAGAAAGVAGQGGVTNIHLHVPNGFVGSPDQLATALSDVISRAKARGLNLSFA